MGLDQTMYSSSGDKEYDWRKHARLQQFMARKWREQNGGKESDDSGALGHLGFDKYLFKIGYIDLSNKDVNADESKNAKKRYSSPTRQYHHISSELDLGPQKKQFSHEKAWKSDSRHVEPVLGGKFHVESEFEVKYI